MNNLYRLAQPTGHDVNPWPVLLDMLTSVLMVFLLYHFLQTVLDIKDLPAMIIRYRQAQFTEAFRHEFRDEIGKTIQIDDRQPNLTQVTFSDRILFDTGEYKLKPMGRGMLKRCASVFHQVSESEGEAIYELIQVEGHTDNVQVTRQAYPRNNWELSAARSISVVQFFTTAGNMSIPLPPEAFSANGYAEFKPVAPNTTPDERAKNRRIEIRVVFSAPKGTTPDLPE